MYFKNLFDQTTGFPAKWRRKGTSTEIPSDDASLPKSVLSVFDWSCLVLNLIQPIRSTSKTWVMTCRRSNFCTRSSDVIFAWKPVVTWLNVGCLLLGGFISVAMSTPPSAVYNSDVDTLKNQAADQSSFSEWWQSVKTRESENQVTLAGQR